MIILFIYQGYIIGWIQWIISLIYQEEIGSCTNNTKALNQKQNLTLYTLASYFNACHPYCPIGDKAGNIYTNK